MVYPALLLLMRTPRLPVVDWTDAPAVLNGLVLFAERLNLVSARVPSHFNRPLLRAGWPGFDCRKGQRFVTLPPRPDRRWVSPSLMSDGYHGVNARFHFCGFVLDESITGYLCSYWNALTGGQRVGSVRQNQYSCNQLISVAWLLRFVDLEWG